jgi:hypothetical protein
MVRRHMRVEEKGNLSKRTCLQKNRYRNSKTGPVSCTITCRVWRSGKIAWPRNVGPRLCCPAWKARPVRMRSSAGRDKNELIAPGWACCGSVWKETNLLEVFACDSRIP